METKKVLVIDDEPDMVTFLTTLLQDNGFATYSASDGKEGIEKVRQEKPNLILLDLVMPNQSGVKFFRHIKKDETLKNIPIIIVTGLTEFKTFIKKCGPVPEPEYFIEKPVNEQVLLREINNHIA